MAARTRSLLSRTAASGRPTIASAGRPLEISTSTLTGSGVTPFSAWVLMVASGMESFPCLARCSGRLSHSYF